MQYDILEIEVRTFLLVLFGGPAIGIVLGSVLCAMFGKRKSDRSARREYPAVFNQ